MSLNLRGLAAAVVVGCCALQPAGMAAQRAAPTDAPDTKISFYTSGHMVYAHEPDLKALHANVAAFIDRTKNPSGH